MKTEHEEQREFVSWFRKNKGDVRIFAIPNGGSRSLSSAARMKVEGVSRGVPDLFIPEWWTWIEMKRVSGGVVAPEQKSWHEYLDQIGYIVIVARGCEEAIKLLEESRCQK